MGGLVDLKWGWAAVFQRNFLVWKKLFWPSLIGNIAEPLFVLVAFGYGIGALVGSVTLNGQAIPYILFLASGSICMSSMNAASFEALYSAYSRMGPQKTWEGILNAPVSLDEIVFAEMVWAAFKALFTATAILGVMVALDISRSPMLLAAWPLLFLVGLCFSSLALIFNALAKGYDFFTYYITLFLTHDIFVRGLLPPRPATLMALCLLRVAPLDCRRVLDSALLYGPLACRLGLRHCHSAGLHGTWLFSRALAHPAPIQNLMYRYGA
jgi:lipooligosaccharide transport system permease protein